MKKMERLSNKMFEAISLDESRAVAAARDLTLRITSQDVLDVILD